MSDFNPNWITEQNIALKSWANLVTSKIKNSASRFQKGKSGMVLRAKGTKYERNEDKLVNSISRKIYMASGVAEGVGFKIERHGIFVQKGVGRGHIVQNGMVVRGYRTSKEAQLMAKKKNRAIAEKVATGGPVNRRPYNWFNPQIDRYLPELADKITAINADAVINELNVRIK